MPLAVSAADLVDPDAGQLAVVPRDDTLRLHDDHDAVGRESRDIGLHVVAERTVVASEQRLPGSDGRVRIVDDGRTAGDLHGSKLVETIPRLDEAGDPWIASQVLHFARRRVGPEREPTVELH